MQEDGSEEQTEMKTDSEYPRTAVICNRKSGTGAENASDSEAEFDSPETIEAIRSVLERHGVPAVTVEADENLAENLKEQRIEFAFNLAEGKSGRDREAQVPGVLGLLGIPYMGSDATAMAVSLDKDMCKRLMASYGIRVPKGTVISAGDDLAEKLRGLPYPIILKPNAEGSGRGIFDRSIAENEADFRELLKQAAMVYDGSMLAEEYLPGREFTVGLLGNGPEVHAFRPMEICYREATDGSYYVYSYRIKKDFRKYVHYECPANIPPETERELMDMAKKAFHALGCCDVARVDFRLNGAGEPCFLELNPLPGLAPDYSDYPMTAESEGYSYDAIVFAVYETALKRTFRG